MARRALAQLRLAAAAAQSHPPVDGQRGQCCPEACEEQPEALVPTASSRGTATAPQKAAGSQAGTLLQTCSETAWQLFN
ncbi:hypothetical protein Anapl_11360 [Anas platyrhynchos]|uniref:Uncharacterized protein n=1 Tax=Anas platyrhynchos TaxID=8839 RepID=R0LPZ4_ANAPL|nr:hypothetical protein Anapl_11360 [Anas platyrhynchos]